MARTKLIAAAVAVAGLVAAFFVSRAIAWQIQDFDRAQAQQDADCDDCVTTATLDALPYIAVGILVYLVVAALLWWLLLRRRAD